MNQVLAKGFLGKLLATDSVKLDIDRNRHELLEHFELVVNTVSMSKPCSSGRRVI